MAVTTEKLERVKVKGWRVLVGIKNPPRVISDPKYTNSDPKLSQIAKSNYFIRPLYELPEKPSSASRSENVHCKYRRLHRTKRLILISKDMLDWVDMLAYLYKVIDQKKKSWLNNVDLSGEGGVERHHADIY